MPLPTSLFVRTFVTAGVIFACAGSFVSVGAAAPSDDRTNEQRQHFSVPASDEGLPGAGPIRRYDWFRNLWRERRAEWAQKIEADRGAVVFLGDSITQGWGGGLGAAFPGMKVANRGISGDTTRGVLIRLAEDVIALKPRAVVLLAGTNDLEEGAAPEVVAENLRLIITELERHDPRMPIVLCQVFPSSSEKQRPVAQIKALNALYLKAVQGRPNVIYLETWPLFAAASGDAKSEEFPDLLHPNEAGYAKWAAALRPIFATLGLMESSPEPFTPEPGFVSLFNGHDLTGWGYRPAAAADIEAAKRRDAASAQPPTRVYVDTPISFRGETATPEGRYVAQAGRLVVTTPPEYRKIQQLWSEREFAQDFILKLEFRATPNADSGVFIRGPQLQVRDFPLAGPYHDLKNYRPQEWNELTITVRGETALCECNGEVLEAAFKVPASGPIGLEGDRGQVEFRRIRIKVL